MAGNRIQSAVHIAIRNTATVRLVTAVPRDPLDMIRASAQCVCVCVDIYRERERERERNMPKENDVSRCQTRMRRELERGVLRASSWKKRGFRRR